MNDKDTAMVAGRAVAVVQSMVPAIAAMFAVDLHEAVAAERARCAAACREVAALYDGHAGAVARQCADAIERGVTS